MEIHDQFSHEDYHATLCIQNKELARYQMHKGDVIAVPKVYDVEHMPFALKTKPEDAKSATNWLTKRRFPIGSKTGREGYEDVKKRFGLTNLRKSHELSLNDHYWLRLSDDEDYKAVNFFQNRYSPDVGMMYFEPWNFTKKTKDFESPDITTGGRCKKRWIQKADSMVSYLHKAGSKKLHQYPVIEYIVSDILAQIDIIPFVRYSLVADGLDICCECQNFVNFKTEFLTSLELKTMFRAKKKDESTYDYMHAMIEGLRVMGGTSFLDNMIAFDRLIQTTDRHMGNIGFIRDIKTGTLQMAPYFDNGSSLFKFDQASRMFHDVEDVVYGQFLSKYGHKIKSLNTEPYMDLLMRFPNLPDEIRNQAISNLQSFRHL